MPNTTSFDTQHSAQYFHVSSFVAYPLSDAQISARLHNDLGGFFVRDYPHPFTSEHTAIAFRSQYWGVRVAIAYRADANLTNDQIDALQRDSEHYVREAVAASPHLALSKEHVATALADTHPQVRDALLRNTKHTFSQEQLKHLLFSNSIATKKAILSRTDLLFSEKHLTFALERFGSSELREMVIRRKEFRPTKKQFDDGVNSSIVGIRCAFLSKIEHGLTPRQIDQVFLQASGDGSYQRTFLTLLARPDITLKDIPKSRIEDVLYLGDSTIHLEILKRKDFHPTMDQVEFNLKSNKPDIRTAYQEIERKNLRQQVLSKIGPVQNKKPTPIL